MLVWPDCWSSGKVLLDSERAADEGLDLLVSEGFGFEKSIMSDRVTFCETLWTLLTWAGGFFISAVFYLPCSVVLVTDCVFGAASVFFAGGFASVCFVMWAYFDAGALGAANLLIA